MTIEFSDRMIPLEDLTRLKQPIKRRGLSDSELAVEIEIQPVEGQDQPTVAFDWEPVSFQEKRMEIQL